MIFYHFSTLCFVLFTTEVLIFSIFKEDYLLGFNFWMDLISTVSLIFDIPYFSMAIFGITFDGNEVNLLK